MRFLTIFCQIRSLNYGVSEGYQLYSALVEMGVDSKLMLFHDETHELSRSGKPLNRIKRLREITLWMDKYLK